MKEVTFASLSYESKRRQTQRERFLAEMEQVVPWAELVALIRPHPPKSGELGRSPMPLQSMLRIHFMQQWYAMPDPAMENALHEIETTRRFAGLELIEDAIPDERTILRFRRQLERHELTKQMLETIKQVVESRGASL